VDIVQAAAGLGVDGARHVAWGDSAEGSGQVVVLDDKTRSKSTVDLGRPCEHTTVLDGHNRRFLVVCSTADGRSSELVLDLRDNSTTTVFSDRERSALGDFYGRIGNNWLEGRDDTVGHSAVVYKNWHTGEIRYSDYADPRDLDSVGLKALGPRRDYFVVAGSKALALIRTGKGYGIELNVRGHRRRIARCSGDCRPVSVKGGLALWRARRGRLRGYVLGSAKRRSWPLSDSAFVAGATKTRVYYGTQTPGRPGSADYRAFSWGR
jgi:hypothetical protein